MVGLYGDLTLSRRLDCMVILMSVAEGCTVWCEINQDIPEETELVASLKVDTDGTSSCSSSPPSTPAPATPAPSTPVNIKCEEASSDAEMGSRAVQVGFI